MKKFKSFLRKPFINQHGSHASKPRRPIVSEEKSAFDTHSMEWHDGTPEGKRHLAEIKDTFYAHGAHKAFENISGHMTAHESAAHYAHGISPDSLINHKEFHAHIAGQHDYSHIKEHHVKSLLRYTSSSVGINKDLTDGGYMDPNRKDDINHIDHAITKVTHSLSSPVHTFHGTTFDIPGHLMTGNATLHSKGFLSSSTQTHIATMFGGHILSLHAPVHHTSLPITEHIGTYTHEKEVLHPRGMVLRPRAMLTFHSPYSGRLTVIPTHIEDVKPTNLE